MKTQVEVVARRRDLLVRLDKAEERFNKARQTSDEPFWARRIRQLEIEIGILNWVLGIKEKNDHCERGS